MSDAVEAARQHMEEKAADELAGVERHGLEPVASFDPVVLTWGVPGQGAICSCVLQLTWLVGSRSSVCVGVCRYLAFGSWPRKWRARDEGQGCEAPAKPACAERTSLTRVSRSPKLAVKSEWRIEQRSIDPVHIFTFRYPGPEPDCLTRPVSEHDQPHIRSPLETAAPTSRLLRAGAQANETILPIGISGHGLPRFVHPDPPELIRSWKICESVQRLSSGDLHHGSLNDDAGGDIFPQRH